MRFNTKRPVTVYPKGETPTTLNGRFEDRPDIYLAAENLADTYVLDRFFREMVGKTVRVEKHENDNPAHVVAFVEVEE